jgi:uncharacterized protein YceH (UPF0502 family)
MNKYSLLSLLLLINSQTAFSQVTVSNRYKRFQYASIAKIVEVIDARIEKEEVGLIINLESKRTDTVRLDNNLNDYLLNWIESTRPVYNNTGFLF